MKNGLRAELIKAIELAVEPAVELIAEAARRGGRLRDLLYRSTCLITTWF
jgi:hypothetical protein